MRRVIDTVHPQVIHVETSLSDAQDEDPGEKNELYEVTNDTKAAEGVLNARYSKN